MGSLFEQFIGLELIRWARLQASKILTHFWRGASGPEIDWLILRNNDILSIEVKWADNPAHGDAKHLEVFLKEYPNATHAYVVCQVSQPQILSKIIKAHFLERFDC